MSLLSRLRRPAPVADEGPLPAPADRCVVPSCRRPWAVPRDGYGLCDECEADRLHRLLRGGRIVGIVGGSWVP